MINVKVLVKYDEGAFPLVHAHEADAGFDICSREAKLIAPGSCAVFKTGVHVAIPEGYCGLLVGKSGLNVNKNVTSTGLIDSGYTGEIVVKLYNHGDEMVAIGEGDKISQIVFIPCLLEANESNDAQWAYYTSVSRRKDAGFGSTGR